MRRQNNLIVNRQAAASHEHENDQAANPPPYTLRTPVRYCALAQPQLESIALQQG